MYYVEFYDRKPGVPLERFHSVTTTNFAKWAERYPTDELVANVGRTWRIGPYPYVLVWSCSGFDRLAEWDEVFRTGTMAEVEDPIAEVLTTSEAGFYRDLGSPLPRPAAGPFFLETFEPWEGVADEIADRAQRAGVELTLLLERIGLLGPDPGGIALYSLPSLAAIERLVDAPERMTAVGCYANVGDEIL